jgi:hypothetical protein
MWKTSTKQNFCSQIYYNIIFYYNSQNTQIQVLENKKQKKVTKHTLYILNSIPKGCSLLFITLVIRACG